MLQDPILMLSEYITENPSIKNHGVKLVALVQGVFLVGVGVNTMKSIVLELGQHGNIPSILMFHGHVDECFIRERDVLDSGFSAYVVAKGFTVVIA